MGGWDCKPCPGGTYAKQDPDNSVDYRCEPCEAGEYSAEGSDTCSTCSDYGNQHYSHAKGFSECVVCGGKVVNNKCTACDPGYGILDGSNCAPCPKGMYSTSGACNNCPAGSFSNRTDEEKRIEEIKKTKKTKTSSTPVKKVGIQEDVLAVEISTDGESSDVEAVPPSQFIPQLDESPVLTSAVQEARKRGSKTMKVTQKQPAPNRTATPQEDVRLSKTGTSQKVVRKSKKTVSPQEVDRIPDPLTSGKKKAKVVKITNRGVAKKTDGHVIKAGATPPLPINTVVDNTTQESQAGLGLAEDTPSYGIFLGDGTNNSTVTKPTSSAQSSGHYSGQHNMGEWAVEKINCKSRLQGKKGKRESEDMQGGEGEIYL